MEGTAQWLQEIFLVYPIDYPDFHEVPCVYLFVVPAPPHERGPVYVGQTQDAGRRFATHEKIGAAIGLGATQIHLQVLVDEGARMALEGRLIAAYKPVLND